MPFKYGEVRRGATHYSRQHRRKRRGTKGKGSKPQRVPMRWGEKKGGGPVLRNQEAEAVQEEGRDSHRQSEQDRRMIEKEKERLKKRPGDEIRNTATEKKKRLLGALVDQDREQERTAVRMSLCEKEGKGILLYAAARAGRKKREGPLILSSKKEERSQPDAEGKISSARKSKKREGEGSKRLHKEREEEKNHRCQLHLTRRPDS